MTADKLTTLEDSVRVYARPELFSGDDQTYDLPITNMKYACPSRYTINSDGVHLRVAPVTNNADSRPGYVVLNTLF